MATCHLAALHTACSSSKGSLSFGGSLRLLEAPGSLSAITLDFQREHMAKPEASLAAMITEAPT